MTSLRIEKGVPLTPRGSFVTIYPFREMSAGDSFVIPSTRAALVKAAYSQFRKRTNGKLRIAVRSIGGGKHRVWLVGKTNERMGAK